VESVLDQTLPCRVSVYVSDDNDWIEGEIDGEAGIAWRELPAS